jgi:REP element-mobilizing transposase RayT
MKGSLYHRTPGWVPFGSLFHIRLRVDRDVPCPLTDPLIAPQVMASARRYHADARWHLTLMVVMPDHIHMIVSFPGEPGMSRTLANWKAYLARSHGIKWQGNYFDHRLRNDDECVEKAHYIRMNPVRACLCDSMDDWKWVVDSSCPDQVAADVPAAAGRQGA